MASTLLEDEEIVIRMSNFSNPFLFLFSNEMEFISAGIHKMLVKIANRAD